MSRGGEETDGYNLRADPVDTVLCQMKVDKKNLSGNYYMCLVNESVRNELERSQSMKGEPVPLLYPVLAVETKMSSSELDCNCDCNAPDIDCTQPAKYPARL